LLFTESWSDGADFDVLQDCLGDSLGTASGPEFQGGDDIDFGSRLEQPGNSAEFIDLYTYGPITIGDNPFEPLSRAYHALEDGKPGGEIGSCGLSDKFLGITYCEWWYEFYGHINDFEVLLS